MSDPTQPPPPDEPPSSPFPESSLTPSEDPPPPHGDPLQPAPSPPAPDASPAPAAPPGAPPPAPAPGATPPHGDPAAPMLDSLWAGAQPPPPQPQPPQPQPPAPPYPPASHAPMFEPPAASGLVSGDPLGGSGYPPGYSSPPPPGALGGQAPPPAIPGGLPAASGATGTYVLSGWWRRVGAAVVDGLIIGIIAIAIMAPLGVGLFATTGEDGSDVLALVGAFLVGMIIIAVVGLAYAPVLMARTNGKTIGRMVTGIRVVRVNGQPITLGFAALREIAVKSLLIYGIAGSLTAGLASLLDVLWPLWDDENRALHDFVVNTRTVLD